MEIIREATRAFDEFKCAARGGEEVRKSVFLGRGKPENERDKSVLTEGRRESQRQRYLLRDVMSPCSCCVW